LGGREESGAILMGGRENSKGKNYEKSSYAGGKGFSITKKEGTGGVYNIPDGEGGGV